MDAFGLADRPKEKAKAIDLILTFNKNLNSLQCDLMRVGFIRLDESPPGATADIERAREKIIEINEKKMH